MGRETVAMPESSREKHVRSMTFILCMGMLAGVLIWAKLRLVTDIPRSAYAVPEEVTADQIESTAVSTHTDDSVPAVREHPSTSDE